MLPSESGIWPLRLLLNISAQLSGNKRVSNGWRTRFSLIETRYSPNRISLVQFPISSGMLPEIKLPYSSRFSIIDKLPIAAGSVPFKNPRDTLISFACFRLPISLGKVPVNRFVFRLSFSTEVNRNSSVGMVPCKLHSEMSKDLSLARLPSSDGIVPISSTQPCKSSDWSCVSSPSSVGRVPLKKRWPGNNRTSRDSLKCISSAGSPPQLPALPSPSEHRFASVRSIFVIFPSIQLTPSSSHSCSFKRCHEDWYLVPQFCPVVWEYSNRSASPGDKVPSASMSPKM